MTADVCIGYRCTGHGCFPPRINSQGCSKTFVNGKAVHCVGHSWLPHGCPDNPPHGGVQASGSGNTFMEGAAVARVGDSISCGSTNASGSGNVFVN